MGKERGYFPPGGAEVVAVDPNIDVRVGGDVLGALADAVDHEGDGLEELLGVLGSRGLFQEDKICLFAGWCGRANKSPMLS